MLSFRPTGVSSHGDSITSLIRILGATGFAAVSSVIHTQKCQNELEHALAVLATTYIF